MRIQLAKKTRQSPVGGKVQWPRVLVFETFPERIVISEYARIQILTLRVRWKYSRVGKSGLRQKSCFSRNMECALADFYGPGHNLSRDLQLVSLILCGNFDNPIQILLPCVASVCAWISVCHNLGIRIPALQACPPDSLLEGPATKSGLRNPPIKNMFIGLSCGADQCRFIADSTSQRNKTIIG